MRQPLHLVDVFTRERYAGNQLAVVTDASDLEDAEMQAFATEIDFSETTHVETDADAGPQDDGTWPVRIFTPEAEIPFAGHPTLGTAYVIREYLANGRPDEVVLDLDVGEVLVEVRESADGVETLWMTQQPPAFGDELARDDLAAVLGLDTADLAENYPVQVVSTGLPTVVVTLAGLQMDPIAVPDSISSSIRGMRAMFTWPSPVPSMTIPDLSAQAESSASSIPGTKESNSTSGSRSGAIARSASPRVACSRRNVTDTSSPGSPAA